MARQIENAKELKSENAKSDRSIRKPGNQEEAPSDLLVSWLPY
jgi:hypothetical protein